MRLLFDLGKKNKMNCNIFLIKFPRIDFNLLSE